MHTHLLKFRLKNLEPYENHLSSLLTWVSLLVPPLSTSAYCQHWISVDWSTLTALPTCWSNMWMFPEAQKCFEVGICLFILSSEVCVSKDVERCFKFHLCKTETKTLQIFWVFRKCVRKMWWVLRIENFLFKTRRKWLGHLLCPLGMGISLGQVSAF